MRSWRFVCRECLLSKAIKPLQNGKNSRIFPVMSEVANVEYEFPFVAAMPKREKTRVQKVLEHFQTIKEISAKKGLLIPARLAAKMLDVTPQRINELMNNGTLERIEVDGHPFVTEDTVIEFASSERKSGRPSKFVQDLEKKGVVKASISMVKRAI